jgi:hypothetical protein
LPNFDQSPGLVVSRAAHSLASKLQFKRHFKIKKSKRIETKMTKKVCTK